MGWALKIGTGWNEGDEDTLVGQPFAAACRLCVIINFPAFKPPNAGSSHGRNSGPVSDTGLRCAIGPTSSTAQGLLLQTSTPNLQGTLSRLPYVVSFRSDTRAFIVIGWFCVLYDEKRGRISIILAWMCQMQDGYQ